MKERRSQDLQTTKTQNQRLGLKSIAVFEAIKGVLVILIGFGLLSFANQDLEKTGEEIISHLHMNPAHHYPRIFLHALAELKIRNLQTLVFGAILYSMIRFIESFGLWFQRPWARWMALISTAIYLPFEFYDIWEKQSVVRISITLLNILLLIYLIHVRRRESGTR